MTKTAAEKLSDLVEAVRALPVDTQQALVEEFCDRLCDFTDGRLSEAQLREVERRIATPRYAETDEVRALFERHGIRDA